MPRKSIKNGNGVVYPVWGGGNLFLWWIFTCVRQNIVCWWRSSKQPTCPYFPHTASYLDWYTWNISVIFSVVDKLNFHIKTIECKFKIFWQLKSLQRWNILEFVIQVPKENVANMIMVSGNYAHNQLRNWLNKEIKLLVLNNWIFWFSIFQYSDK